MKFDSLNLDPSLLKGIAEMGYQKCTPVQEQGLPESLLGRDICIQAQTGTGKTGVFLITIIQRLIEMGPTKDEGNAIRALILVPTRELAVQVETQAIALCKHLPFKTVSMYGGVGYDKQQKDLLKNPEIAVATPGRLIDFIKSRTVDVSRTSILVVDEADRMFDMGFMPDVRWIVKKSPEIGKKQAMILSATLDARIRRLAGQFMKDAVEVEVEPDQITVDKVKQLLFHIGREDKMRLLLTLIEKEQMEKLLIFTNMKRTAEDVSRRLNSNGHIAEALTGDVAQQKRLRLVEKFKENKINILVATDVAARGLHVDGITHVINFDLPSEAASYVHRIGRTARAGAEGIAYTLACEDLVEHLEGIEKYIEQKIEIGHVDFELVDDKLGNYRAKTPGRRGGFGGKSEGGYHGAPRGRSSSAGGGRKTPQREYGTAKEGGAKKPFQRKHPEGGRKSEHIPEKSAVKKGMNQEERLAYYKKKYGESFSQGSK
ncbi:MAG: DEAD/DEAH box helicase [Nitrospinota bacterium]|nr:DEAD/DEAH box helicase [Nitrospinota bacterium]